MEAMNIALLESNHFLQERTSVGDYRSARENVRELVSSDYKRKVEERNDARSLEWLDSGEPIKLNNRIREPLGIVKKNCPASSKTEHRQTKTEARGWTHRTPPVNST